MVLGKVGKAGEMMVVSEGVMGGTEGGIAMFHSFHFTLFPISSACRIFSLIP